MSLINEALKKAKRQRHDDPTAPVPPVPGGGTITRRGQPRSAKSLILISAGAVVLVVLSVFFTVYLGNRAAPPPLKVTNIKPPAPKTEPSPKPIVVPPVAAATWPPPRRLIQPPQSLRPRPRLAHQRTKDAARHRLLRPRPSSQNRRQSPRHQSPTDPPLRPLSHRCRLDRAHRLHRRFPFKRIQFRTREFTPLWTRFESRESKPAARKVGSS